MKLIRKDSFFCLIRNLITKLIWAPVFIITLFIGTVYAQNMNSGHTVKGKVVDSATKSPLPGVNIVIKGTMHGTSTNKKGRYNLNNVQSSDTLVFSFIGYVTKFIPVKNRSTINVRLSQKTIHGKKMVVVGYGEQKQTSLTSSVSNVNVKNVKKQNLPDVRESLQGVSPGVTIQKNGGAPGSKNLQINIRGINTIGNTNPLILVNGIEQNLSDLNPDNIKSISVLKGAAATSIYGSRGANGVILVTTKQPQKGKLHVSYSGYYGIQTVAHKPPQLGLRASLNLINTEYKNQPNGKPKYTQQQIDQWVNSDNRFKYPEQNAFWNVLFRQAPVENHSLTFNGGNGNIQSRLSLNYNNEGGIIPNSNSRRYSINFDNNIDVTDHINVSANLLYRNKINEEPYGLNNDFPQIYFELWHWTEFTTPQYPNGTFGLSGLKTNPLMLADMSGWQHHVTDYAVGNLKANVDILPNLTYTFQFGGHISLASDKNYKNNFTELNYYNGNQVFDYGYNNSNVYNNRDSRWNMKNLLKYDLTIHKNQIHALLGYEQTKANYHWSNAYREQFYNNQITALNAASQNNWSNGGNNNERRLRSVFGRIHYSYANTYMIEANARYDGSSKFYGSNNQYSFFPSFSAGWRVSKENFWKPLKSIVNEFKLRGSWGKAGNNDVGLYTFFPALNHTTYDFGGNLVDGYVKTNISNKNLTWETTTQTDLGFDAQLFNGRFGVTFDWYKKKTTGILLTLPIPATVGLNPAPQNAGRVDNNGWELSLSYKDVVNKDLNFSVSGNISNNHNKVISLAGTGPYTGRTVKKVGVPLDSFWGYKILGLFQSKQEIANYPTYAGKNNTYPGDLKYADLNGDGKISSADKTVIGNGFPHYQFGLNGSVNYKEFDLSFFIQGVGQLTAQEGGPPQLGGAFQGFILKIAGDYWTPNNRHARFPRPQKFSHKNFQESSWWNINAAYVRLKNVQLGYTLPSRITKRVGISNLRFYVSGMNLLTISNALKWGTSPENPAFGNAGGYYPGTKSYTMGINLKF